MSCQCCEIPGIEIKIGYCKCGNPLTYMTKYCYEHSSAEEAFINAIVTYINYSSDFNYTALSIGSPGTVADVTFAYGTININTMDLSGSYTNTSNVTTPILFTGNTGTFTDTNGTIWTIVISGNDYIISNNISDLVFDSQSGGSIYEP